MRSALRHMAVACLLMGAFTLSHVALSHSASAAGTCSTDVSMEGSSTECKWTYSDYQTSSGDGAVWTVKARCDNAGICASSVTCVENGEEGILYDVLRNGDPVGYVCVPEKEREKVDPGAAAMKAFKTYAWPASTLAIQPPGGQTLVNFETIFYTTNSEPTVRQFTLLGSSITVRATPVTYVWHFGDGEEAETTSAGHSYPHQDIVHKYADLDPVTPSVDTVYGGDYKIGEGEWTPIDATLTVRGAPQSLEILEAIPELVENPNS